MNHLNSPSPNEGGGYIESGGDAGADLRNPKGKKNLGTTPDDVRGFVEASIDSGGMSIDQGVSMMRNQSSNDVHPTPAIIGAAIVGLFVAAVMTSGKKEGDAPKKLDRKPGVTAAPLASEKPETKERQSTKGSDDSVQN